MQWFAQKLHQGSDFVPMKVANTIVRDFEVYADGELVYKDNNNYHSLVKVKIDKATAPFFKAFCFVDTVWGTVPFVCGTACRNMPHRKNSICQKSHLWTYQ